MYDFPLFSKHWVRIEGPWVVIDCQDAEGNEYEIPVRDLHDPYFVAEWFANLACKQWVRGEHLRQLSLLVKKINEAN